MIEVGDDEGILTLEDPVTDISEGSSHDTDMMIDVDKTKILYVRTQDPVPTTTPEEVIIVCKSVSLSSLTSTVVSSL